MLDRQPKQPSITTRKDLAEQGYQTAARTARSMMETLIIDAATLEKWKDPPFQRPLKVNDKVRELSEELKRNGGIIKGTIEIGIIDAGEEAGLYLCDGKHRMQAFVLSGMEECIADVSFKRYDSLADMAIDFVELNTRLVTFQPDDNLRAYEGSSEGLQTIRRLCPFVGYGNIKRNYSSSLLSMSAVLKQWYGSANETPAMGQTRSTDVARMLTVEDAEKIAAFLNTALTAWSRDPAYSRLWLSLNITVCMWMWRRLVLDKERPGNRRYIVLTPEQFKRCLMSLSADQNYLDWLVGRTMSERDRGPAYGRIKALFGARILEDTAQKARFPQPAWHTM
jgi:hypothetical protein